MRPPFFLTLLLITVAVALAPLAGPVSFADPFFLVVHQQSVGMRPVIVNGVLVLRDGEQTGALPGRALEGPGACARSGSAAPPAGRGADRLPATSP